MNTNKKSLLSLIALVMLFSCTRESQQLVSQKNSVSTEASVSQKIKDATFCFAESGRIVGRCFLVAPNKVATNIHVIDGRNSTSTYVRSRYATWSIRGVTAYDLKNDLVILKISGGGTPLPLGDSDTVQDGEPISIVEYSGVMEHKVTEGVIHSVRNTDKWLRMKIDAPRGTSGSAVVNSEGKVIGVVARGDSSYVYAAPSNLLRALLARSESREPLAQWQQREQISAHRYCTQANQKYGDKHYEEAIVDLDKALELNPEFIDAYYGRATTKLSLAVSEFKSGDVKKARSLYQAAIEDFDEAIKLDPEYSIAYSTRGAVKIEAAKLESSTGNEKKAQALYSAAIDDLTQTTKVEPKEFAAYYNRGIANSSLVKFKANQGNVVEVRRLHQAAMADFTKGIQLEPENAIVYNRRGWLKYQMGRFEGEEGHESEALRLYQAAIDDYTQAIQLDTEYAYAHNNRGKAKYLLGKSEAAAGNREEARKLYEAAITDVNRSIQLDSDNAYVYRNRGTIKIALGTPQDAIADFDKAIEIKPEYADAYYKRAQAKESLGQTEEAKADFEKAKELDSDVGK